jgi:hypothetical protein
MTDYTAWTDGDLQHLYDSLRDRVHAIVDQEMEIVAEQAKRRQAARTFPRVVYRFDELQADRDEYAEEMSLGGRNYNPEGQ